MPAGSANSTVSYTPVKLLQSVQTPLSGTITRLDYIILLYYSITLSYRRLGQLHRALRDDHVLGAPPRGANAIVI